MLEYFDVQDGVLIGHSMGGFLSLIFLLNHLEAARAHLSHAIIHIGEPSDIARACVFLAANDFATGTILRVDGGEGLAGGET